MAVRAALRALARPRSGTGFVPPENPEPGDHFRVAFDNAPIGVALLTPDGRWSHANRALCDLLGYSADALRRLTVADITHPDDLERSRGLLGGEQWERRIEKRYIRANGATVWVALTTELVRDGGGKPLYLVAHVEDITQRRETERALREAEERFRRAFEDAPIGMALVSPEGRFLRVNRTLCEITGYEEPHLLRRTFQEITHPHDLEDDLDQVRRAIDGEIRTYQMEKRYLRPNGEIVWVKLSVTLVRDDEGVPLYFVSEVEDIGERKRAELELQRLADFDSLTGLGNRRKLTADLERVLASRDEDGQHLLVILDLDGFKHYNDTFGHPAGDALLARLAAKLAAAAQPAGEAYRLGGDEFCVLAAPPADTTDAFLSATVAALDEQGDGFGISASFGAAFLPDEAGNPSSALTVADQRLYAQKHLLHAGRGGPHEVLQRAIWEREPGLSEHNAGVAEHSLAVGRSLGLPNEVLEELRLAAELHDVGKLAVPDAVLQKRGPLSDEEWILMRQHTLIGQRILGPAPALRGVGAIVRSTHERWDGGGYPDGLAAEEIPLAARIIAVCDAYVAMTSGRPYRTPMPQQAALEELRSTAGTQFDPAIVRVFCDRLGGVQERDAAGARSA